VICTASLVEGVPPVEGGLWAPVAHGRVRDAARRPPGRAVRGTSTRGRLDGRIVEIQRLIGRSLRAVIDLEPWRAKTVYLDCDVLDADGGTRCAAITERTSR